MIKRPVKDPRPLLTPKQIEKIAIQVVKDACSGLAKVKAVERIDQARAERQRVAELKATNLGYPRAVDGVSFLFDIPDYYACSGGTRTLHYLAALVAETGAAVATTSLNFFNPMLPVRKRALPEDISITCEAVKLDTTGARRRVWWVLFFAGVFGPWHADKRITKNECVFVYEKKFLESVQKICDYPLSEKDILYIPHIDPQWAFPGNKTIEACIYAGAAASKPSIPLTPGLPWASAFPGAVEIPPMGEVFRDGEHHDQFYAHQRTIAILRAARNMYSVDHHTALLVEAALCGCRTWLVQKGGTATELMIGRETMLREVMNPIRDLETAARFVKQVLEFFK